ncbi:hypothetical protein EXE30_06845 [Acinetobacter halotolerans]|uniref:HeH/LEM domain protein n=1 Tax=Acinetobacter halotolerans TaxID=1752076 RepID=A0A4Q6XGW9_9GAMM|nr:hypothetical protein [Acinetobacter halotolerans]RZF53687.1 hypothetical protein EXE30_06845 [Acinetobacter halotolerans]
MQEYPKALYIDKKKSSIAKNAEHEKKLREIGFVDYSEAPEPINENIGQTESQVNDVDLIPVEQFDALGEKLAEKEQQLNVVVSERDKLKAENDDLKAQLKKEQELVDKLEAATAPKQPEKPQDAAPDYSKLTAKELREILDAKGFKYLQRDNVDTLRALLTQPVKTEE